MNTPPSLNPTPLPPSSPSPAPGSWWPLVTILLAPAILMALLSATRQADNLVVTLCFISCPISGVISGVIVAHRIDRSFPTKVLVGIGSSFAFSILCLALCFVGCIAGNATRY